MSGSYTDGLIPKKRPPVEPVEKHDEDREEQPESSSCDDRATDPKQKPH
jgi:hypothetical protein